MSSLLIFGVLVLVFGAYAFGEWRGSERERMRNQRRAANVLDFTPRLRRIK